MRIAVVREVDPGEDRVAATPETVKKLKALGADIVVEPGAAVRKGASLLVLEAMKMENEIQAPGDGVVDEIYVKAGDTVDAGADLVHVRPA